MILYQAVTVFNDGHELAGTGFRSKDEALDEMRRWTAYAVVRNSVRIRVDAYFNCPRSKFGYHVLPEDGKGKRTVYSEALI